MTIYNLKLFAILLPIFLTVDLLYLGVLMKGFYSAELGELARRDGDSLSPRWGAALLVYVLIPAGIVWFVGPLLSPEMHLWQVFFRGAVYGLILYGVYDLTNYATLEKWTVRLTIADMAWGAFLNGAMTVVMVWIKEHILS